MYSVYTSKDLPWKHVGTSQCSQWCHVQVEQITAQDPIKNMYITSSKRRKVIDFVFKFKKKSNMTYKAYIGIT